MEDKQNNPIVTNPTPSGNSVPDAAPIIEKGTRKRMKEFDVHPAEMNQQPEQPRKQFAVLDQKDMRRLTSNSYDQVKEKFKNVYLIRNIKTGKIAEIHAASAVHAANLLKWNPKKVQLLMAREDGKAPVTIPAKESPRSESDERL